MHGMVGTKKEALFTLVESERSIRGNTMKIQKQHAKLRLRENAFSNRVANNWNKLTDKVVLAKSINLFKDGVDKALSKDIDKYSYGYGAQWQQVCS